MNVGRNQLMEHILKLTKGVFDVLLDCGHLIFCINLWSPAVRRGPDGIRLCTVWIQKNLKILILSRLLIDKTNAAGLVHKHCYQDALWFSFGGVGQPFTAVQPFLELPQPVGSHLREASFIHTEGELHKMFLHRVLEQGAFFS